MLVGREHSLIARPDWPGLPTLCNLLDPSESEQVADLACWIPAGQIASRAYELPDKTQVISIADVGKDARLAQDILAGMGRHTALTPYGRREQPKRGRLWDFNPWLADLLKDSQTATALDLGCGSGRDAVAMASAGIAVTAVDRLPDSIERGRLLESRYRLGGLPVAWICSDIMRELPAGSYDLIILFAFLPKAFLNKVGNLLNPGGRIAIEAFSESHRATYGKPGADHVLGLGEAATLMPNFQRVLEEEVSRPDRKVIRVLAKLNNNS